MFNEGKLSALKCESGEELTKICLVLAMLPMARQAQGLPSSWSPPPPYEESRFSQDKEGSWIPKVFLATKKKI